MLYKADPGRHGQELLTGDSLREPLEEAASRRRNVRLHYNGGAAEYLATSIDHSLLMGLTDDGTEEPARDATAITR